jgi:RNA-directed DNA polymerase
MTPEPRDKLDATTELEAAPAVEGDDVVNGPEGEFLDWDAVDWRQVEEDVRRLRQRIFAASQAGDLKKVRNLQKLMVRHEALLFRMEVEDLDLPAVVAVG